MNSYDIKNSLQDAIDNDNLFALLEPITTFAKNSTFVNNLEEIIKILMEDRDGDLKFDIDDLELLLKDPSDLFMIVNTLVLISSAIPEINLRYLKETSEEIIFKILVYAFLILVPDRLNYKIDRQTQEKIIDVCAKVYQVILSSKIVKDAFSRAASLFRGWCWCITMPKEDVVDKEIHRFHKKIIKRKIIRCSNMQ